jgi:hypothetical protein
MRSVMLTIATAILAVAPTIISAQSGGAFQITRSVIASGGGQSSGGAFSQTGTIGETVAGGLSNAGSYSIVSGFWPGGLAPSSASAAISGRVLTIEGGGIRNAMVVITDQTGNVMTARSSSMGYYRIEGLIVGQTYTVTVNSKRYAFVPRAVTLSDELSDFDLVASP